MTPYEAKIHAGRAGCTGAVNPSMEDAKVGDAFVFRTLGIVDIYVIQEIQPAGIYAGIPDRLIVVDVYDEFGSLEGWGIPTFVSKMKCRDKIPPVTERVYVEPVV